MEYGVDLQKALSLRKEGKHKEAYAYLKQACKNKDGYACYFMHQAYESGGWTKCLNKHKAKKYLELAKTYECSWVTAGDFDNYRMGLILQKQSYQSVLLASSYFMSAYDEGLTFAAYDVWKITGSEFYLIKAAEYGDCRAKYELFKNAKILKDLADQGHSASCVDFSTYRFQEDNFDMKYTTMSRDWKFIRKRLRYTLEYDELCYYGQICSVYRKKHGIVPNPLKLDPYWKALLVYEAKFRAKKTAMLTLFLCVPLYKDIRKIIWNCADVRTWPIPDLGLT